MKLGRGFKIGDRVMIVRNDMQYIWSKKGSKGTIEGQGDNVGKLTVRFYTLTKKAESYPENWTFSNIDINDVELLESNFCTYNQCDSLINRINNLKFGWTKEVEDILKEIHLNEYRFIIPITYSGGLCIIDRFRKVIWNRSYSGQGEKLHYFKEALLWLLDKSEMKREIEKTNQKRENKEKRYRLEKESQKLVKRLSEINNQLYIINKKED